MKKLTAFILACLCALSLCACSPREEIVNTCLLIGLHDNSAMKTLNTALAYPEIYSSAHSYGTVSIVTVDGKPFLAGNYKINDPEKNISNNKRRQLAKKYANDIASTLSGYVAKTPEVDTLAAIQVGANTLNGGDGAVNKLTIFDTGLSTTGLLNFADQNLFDTPPSDIVAQLKALHALPDLTGISVTWLGLGQVAGDQPTLSSSHIFKLQTLWNEILLACGAESVTFDPSPIVPQESSAQIPECSIVPIIEDKLEAGEALPEIIRIDEKSNARFEPDSAVFIDEAMAKKELEPVAKYLTQSPDNHIYLIGMIATSKTGDGKKLSADRAEACKKLLLSFGVNENQVRCIGLGDAPNPLRVEDCDAAGNLIEESAQKNRAVFFIQPSAEILSQIPGI